MCSLTISRIILLSLGTQIYNRSVDKFIQPSYLLLVIIVDTLASFQNERYFTRGGAQGCIGGLEFNKQVQLGSLCQFFSRPSPLLWERKKRRRSLWTLQGGSLVMIWEGIVKYRHLPWDGFKQYSP